MTQSGVEVSVQFTDEVDLLALLVHRDTLIADVFYAHFRGGQARIAKRRTLTVGGQKRRAPIVHTPVRQSGTDRDERGQ